jgi:hypothetical protein
MSRPAPRRLILFILAICLGAAALYWLTRRVPPSAATAGRSAATPAANSSARSPASPAGSVRSTATLRLDAGTNELPDHRTAKEEKDAVVKHWGRFIEGEKARLGAEIFDPAARRWLARPRVRELIEEWKTLEQGWPERSEDQRAALLPRIEAMWREGMGELAAELTASGHPTTLPPR